ncbi:MAG: DUF2335 domain-containing protein [Nitrospirae bacterium]|nr:DUF2335 domain-containing protein [Nitrospirota bacterium]
MAKKAKSDASPPVSVQPSLTRTRSSAHSGPIPSPQSLAEYDNFLPGLANRIVIMAENNLRHRHEYETEVLRQNNETLKLNDKIIDYEAKERKRGQIFGFLIGIAGLSTSLMAAYFNHETTASIIGSTTVIGLVSAFVYGKHVTSKFVNKQK